MYPEHPEHLASFPYVGTHRYSLTFCTDGRRPRFTSEDRVELVRLQIVHVAQREEFEVIAYCFMPDHLHLLVHGQNQTSDLKRFVARAKQFSGYYYAQTFGERLWQRYGYERVVRDSEPTNIVVKYLLENPLRARLVARVQDYPYFGSSNYSRQELLEYVSIENARSG
jgi:putative transposase